MLKTYDTFRNEVTNCRIGQTPQFWMIYLNIMKLQHQARAAVHINNFELRVDAWQRMFPYYFVFNKTNYSRLGTYYVQSMMQIDERYPGLKDLLVNHGLSVQAQVIHPLRTSIDQRGEQTINKDAKTAGRPPSSLLMLIIFPLVIKAYR